MGDFEIPIRPIPGTVNELREESRRDREDRARGDAMSRAEEAGRAAAGTGEDLWSLPEESRQRFGTQLAGLDERAGSIPRVDIVFKEDARRDRESTRSRDDSIHDAEQAELRPGLARGDRKPAQP